VLYRETVEVNVAGTFFMSRTVTPYFIEKGYGKIINLTTSLRNFYSVGQSPYGVTKAAIDASTYIWARDLAGKGVTVNALLPGGACDNGDLNRPPELGRKLLPADIMNPLLVWMCSARSDGATARASSASCGTIASTRTKPPPAAGRTPRSAAPGRENLAGAAPLMTPHLCGVSPAALVPAIRPSPKHSPRLPPL
jgi:NAD(P)-dependent dehydrogenase (short-subunit alcohol dehydrogenase family)